MFSVGQMVRSVDSSDGMGILVSGISYELVGVPYADRLQAESGGKHWRIGRFVPLEDQPKNHYERARDEFMRRLKAENPFFAGMSYELADEMIRAAQAVWAPPVDHATKPAKPAKPKLTPEQQALAETLARANEAVQRQKGLREAFQMGCEEWRP